MSKLYEKVQYILDSNTMDEAESRLYGSDGIPINTKEYYQKIISNFIKKKEVIISKNGKNIYFDLDKNINDAWDLVFISEYVQKQIQNEIEVIDKEVSKLKSAKSSREELDKLNHSKMELCNSLASIRKMSDLNRITINSFKSFENVEPEINKLKEAINVIEKIRGSFEHKDIYGNKNFVNVDKEMEINNPHVKLNIKIPIEYLEGFTKGRIIAREDDKIVLEKTNSIISQLMEYLGYNISEIESFFYNTDPNILSNLLDFFDNNITELYKLPYTAFKYYYNIDKLASIFSNKEMITKLPGGAFKYPDDTIFLLTNLPYGKRNLELLQYFVDAQFIDSEDTVAFVKELSFDIDVLLQALSSSKELNSMFFYQEGTKKLLNELPYGDNNKNRLLKLPSEAFEEPENLLFLLNHLDDETVFSLPDNAFHCPNNILNLIKELPYGKDNKSVVCKLPNEAIENAESINILLNGIFELKYDYKMLLEFPRFFFKYPDNSLIILNAVRHKNNAMSLIKQLPEIAFQFPNSTILFLEKLPFGDKNVEVIKELPMNSFINPENIFIFLNKYGISQKSLKLLLIREKLEMEDGDFLALIDRFSKINIDIQKIPDDALNNLLFGNIQILDNNNFWENIYLLRNLYNITEEKFEELPYEFFTCNSSILDLMFQRYNTNISKSIFGINNPKIISLLIYMENIFSQYNVHNPVDVDISEYIGEQIKSTQFLTNALKDTIEFNNNITAVDMDINRFHGQFGYVPSKEDRIKLFLKKMRNASCHFRIRPVKDKNGIIIEDKVYLYDEDNYGNNNFNIILNIRDVLEITNIVEKSLDKEIEKQSNHKTI